ncbi:hypothetical protein NDU88_006248 [Pleurodeles waltl]|uniref:Uncharacterized protein n=1 Tax=Pleurodeles waltl TaxID=8319 RepID=A0AAV7X101_PLEWA|nr:hypothetical protein NDU88_006248 [Pleurodeles waltl]
MQPRTSPALSRKRKIKERRPRTTFQDAPVHSLAPQGAMHSCRAAPPPPTADPQPIDGRAQQTHCMPCGVTENGRGSWCLRRLHSRGRHVLPPDSTIRLLAGDRIKNYLKIIVM